MIIIMRNDATAQEIAAVEKQLADYGFQTHPIYGEKKAIIGAIGDKRRLSMNQMLMMAGVENVVPIMRPYKLAGKELKKDPTVITVKGVEIGGKSLAVFAGRVQLKARSSLPVLPRACRQPVRISCGAARLNPGHPHTPLPDWRETA